MPILINIEPKQCVSLLNGSSTALIMKTAPYVTKMLDDNPLQCYMYCAEKPVLYWSNSKNNYDVSDNPPGDHPVIYNCKIVGEFICENILLFEIKDNKIKSDGETDLPTVTGLSAEQICEYIGNGNKGYAVYVKNIKPYHIPMDPDKFADKHTNKPIKTISTDYVHVKER